MKLVVVTPAGREKYLRLLSHYVLGSRQVDEWQLWDNCRNESDRAYLHRLAASDPRCTLKRLEGTTGRFEDIGGFWRFCSDRDAFYLRLDDDIVFLEDGFFSKFLERALAERGGPFWFSPVVINNAICNWLLKHFSKVVVAGPVTAQAMCPWTWRYADFPRALHPVFIAAVRAQATEFFRVPDREIRFSRFSINAIGVFGADCVALGERLCPPEEDEEEWLSASLPALLGRPGKIFGDLFAAHFAFHTQENALLHSGLLEAYYDLAGLARPTLDLPSRWPEPPNRPKFTISLAEPESVPAVRSLS